MVFNGYDMIPVTVISSINGGGKLGVVPRVVVFTIGYYQRTQGYKRIVTARIYYPPEHQCHTYTDGSPTQVDLENAGI